MRLRLLAVTFLAAGLGFTTFLAAPPKQVKILPGSVMRGEQVVDDNGCFSCHAMDGQGGNRAPDFAQLAGRSKTPGSLATTMWNHSPRMWAEFETTGRQVPKLTSTESADLFAYFYSTLYFAPKGDPARGQNLFQDRNCVSCHSEVLDQRPVKSLLGKWTDLKDPVAWAERMWNHSNEMVAATSNRGIEWPRFSEQDIVDLVVFLSRLSPDSPQSGAFGIGEPDQGRIAFESTCESCHTFGPTDRTKVDLLARSRPSTIMGYAAAMWNHAPLMRNRDTSLSTEVRPGEMRDLMAFLFSQRYFFEQGNASKGAAVFEAKRCANCHEARRAETGAPDLSKVSEEFSPITLTSALWRHGPSMLRAMKQQGLSWPEFQNDEMTDLIAYLNSRLITRVAR